MKTKETKASLDIDLENNRTINSKGGPGFSSAVQEGALNAIRYLVDDRKVVHLDEFINEIQKRRSNVIILAVENNQFEVLKYFLEEKNGDVNLLSFKRTPLSVAAEQGFLKIVKYLVERGANTDPQVREEYHPLVIAAKSGQLDVLKYLLEEVKVDVNVCDYWGDTPLEAAARNKHHEIVKYLIERKANIDEAILQATRNGRLKFAAYFQNMLNGGIRRTVRSPNILQEQQPSEPVIFSRILNLSRLLMKESSVNQHQTPELFWSYIIRFDNFLFGANYFVGLNGRKPKQLQSLERISGAREKESFIMNAIEASPPFDKIA